MTELEPRPNRPERIYGWLDSQLSIARFYGGITYQGCSYLIDTADPAHPLVRADVLDAQRKAARSAEKARAQAVQAKHLAALDRQNNFFNGAKDETQ